MAVLVYESSPVSRRSDGLPKNRLAIDCGHYAQASEEGATIKLATIAAERALGKENCQHRLSRIVESVRHGHPSLICLATQMVEVDPDHLVDPRARPYRGVTPA